jgi:hypothetical protein
VCACIRTLVSLQAKCVFSAPYCIVICGLSGCTIFPQIISHSRQDYQKKGKEHKLCVLIFSKILSQIFLIIKNQRNIITNVHRYSCKVSVNVFNIKETLIFFKDFRKSSNITFHGNLSNMSRVVPCRQPDRTTDMTRS